ncbi:restriction endonuclease subunit S [Campylobacter upsaliensis]|uniref:restriction endonuclease subunit S n=1 Tax=Campylobacter upsaliensis TaxID=28080 RepID=UPI0022EAB5C8|nr:restriction endonuclease subunit S [Campylobacter upsaliensis]MEB2796107.1 restriction endonuclease subunit S [Campylobacter upsaliensis]MEB2822171.1 restriction endonuclease subunit S [Campylobacter upsaliensis]
MRVYKPSGIEWLGEIPKHWEIRRLKYLFYISKEESRDEFPNVLSLTQNGIIERDITTNKGQLAQNYIGYNIVKRGDIILNPMDLSSGYAAKSTFEGVISQAYIKIRPLKTLNLSYYESFFQNLYHYKILWHLGKGISYDHRWTLGNDVFLNIKIPLPPLQEQKEIAEFLDSKCEKIQNYIDKKQKLITLLQEKKQALINEVVTKGLNPNIEFKNSEIEYLGLIPHHWEVRRMKFMASIHNGREQTEIADENGIYPIYGSGGILGKSMYFIYDKPSVLLGRKGTIDKPLFVEEPFWTIDTMFYTSISKIVLPKYFYYLCLTIDFQFYISGSAIPSMTQYDLANISFALPPLQEQKQIANFLDEKCEKINSAIEKTKRQIELIKEYKNTLINEAVCGRINFLEGILNE